MAAHRAGQPQSTRILNKRGRQAETCWHYFSAIEGDYSTKPRNVVHRRRQGDPYESLSDDEKSPLQGVPERSGRSQRTNGAHT